MPPRSLATLGSAQCSAQGSARGAAEGASRLRLPHEVLGLSPREEDAVRVIEVSQLMLRRWRRAPLGIDDVPLVKIDGDVRNRIKEIVAARQAMLEKIYARWRRN
jgi:hypothetical protein